MNQLSIVKIKSTSYYHDERLNQLRQVENPHNYISFSSPSLLEEYLESNQDESEVKDIIPLFTSLKGTVNIAKHIHEDGSKTYYLEVFFGIGNATFSQEVDEQTYQDYILHYLRITKVSAIIPPVETEQEILIDGLKIDDGIIKIHEVDNAWLQVDSLTYKG